MIDVSELITDPDFAKPFMITRSSGGTFTDGLYTAGEITEINRLGIIQPYAPKEVEYDALGNAITGDIKIWSLLPIYLTRDEETEEENDSGYSDIVKWESDDYKVTWVKNWKQHGYYSAVAKKVLPI